MKTLAPQSSNRVRGFTMVELIVGSAIMLFAVVGALSVYSRSNKVAVEQQMVTEVQNDVRSSMFFLSRDLRMAGAGLPEEFSSCFIQGTNNEAQGGAAVAPDRIQLMGNLDDPLNLPIRNYMGESSVVLDLVDFSFEQYPYPTTFYDNKYVLILPRPDSGCRSGQVRVVTQVTRNAGGTNERFNFSPGLAPDVNPPGGLSGTCSDPNDYDGGQISFIDVKEYWLDVTGNYPGLTAGVDGYIGGGQGGILYVTHNGVHFPMARNIENFQVEYNGDMDSDLNLDGWLPWQNAWTNDPSAARIQQVRMWVLGRTDRTFTSVGGQIPGAVHIYRRPDVSDSPGPIDDPDDPNYTPDDKHRRFLLESMSNVRNMSLNLYNLGQR